MSKFETADLDELLKWTPKNDNEKAEKAKLLRDRVRTLREGNLNLTNLIRNRNEAYAYHWVHNSPDRINTFQGLHYEIVRHGAGGNDAAETGHQKPDGTHVRGDTILMRCRKEIVELLNMENQLRATEAIDGAKEEFFDFSRAEKVPAQTLRR